jgi:glycosyltransferase involved in cell wall biosynthesis
MMHNKHATKRSVDAVALEKRLGQPVQFLNRHIKHPDSPTLNRWYNGLKVWFAPTELEGLHNPPMEAALAGCALVCSDHPRNGMWDYVISNETALVYPARNIDAAAECVRRLLTDASLRQHLNARLVRRLLDVVGTRAQRMYEFASRLRAMAHKELL